MAFQATTLTKPRLQGQMKLARLLEMPERAFEDLVREIEQDDIFRRLLQAGVISLQPYPRARFAARRFDGWEMRACNSGLPDLIDGKGDLARLMLHVGQKRFEDCFLKDGDLSDAQRARLCGISTDEARRLRDYVDRLYVQAEFESPSEHPLPTKYYSAVGGIELEDGRPVLAFFHREIWKGRYRIDEERRAELLNSLPPRETRRVEQLMRRVEILDRRKSTLYRVLEALLEIQAEFLRTGDPDRRRSLTQRALASKLGVAPSVLNCLIGNKSIQLPWGLEAPIRTLIPSAKSLLRDRLYSLALERPNLPDENLRREINRLYAARLSRRSVAQYRQELGLGGCGQRGQGAVLQ